MTVDMRSLLPSERAEAKAELEAKAQNLQKQRISLLREDFGRTFQTEHGKRVLAWLFERCGYDKPKLGANAQGIIDAELTLHNAMEENLYIAVRRFIPVDVLQQVEYGQIKPSGTIEAEPQKPTRTSNRKKKG